MGTKPLIIAARYKLLLVLPFVIIVPIALVLALASRSTSYISSATVWVDPSVFLETAQLTSDNPYLSPAQNQAAVVNELMQTDSFAVGVGRRADPDAAGAAPDGPPDRALAAVARDGTSVHAGGAHLVIIANQSVDPARAQALVQAVVDEYREFYAQNLKDAAQEAEAFYQGRLETTRNSLTDARAALAEYVRANPAAVANINDSRYIELQGRVDRAQDDFDNTQVSLQQVQVVTSSTLTGQDRSFRLVDPATLPQAPVTESLRSLAILPIAGMLLAISLSAAIYGFLLRTDNSIRIAEDLEALPGLKLLGTVPDVSHIRRPRWPRHFYRLAITALGVNAHR
jgi:uncharacterized protein involved in exopolysaccharide biosynthesis